MTESQLFRKSPTPADVPRSLRENFEQRKYWHAVEGWLKIEDMTPTHRLNAARGLERGAEHIEQLVAFEELRVLYGAPDEVVDDFMQEMNIRQRNPGKWIRETKLYKALVKGIKIDAGTDGK